MVSRAGLSGAAVAAWAVWAARAVARLASWTRPSRAVRCWTRRRTARARTWRATATIPRTRRTRRTRSATPAPYVYRQARPHNGIIHSLSLRYDRSFIFRKFLHIHNLDSHTKNGHCPLCPCGNGLRIQNVTTPIIVWVWVRGGTNRTTSLQKKEKLK